MLNTIRGAILLASRLFLENGVVPTHQQAQWEAECLAEHVLECDRTTLLLDAARPFPTNRWAAWESLVARRVRGEPLQYVLGGWDFYGRSFLVTPDVLIPRPETELLVEAVLQRIHRHASGHVPLHIADIGTGSGAIAITLALESPMSHVHAVDLSTAALQVATRNRARLQVAESSISFYQGDLLAPLVEKGIRLDVLVSNPPYIPTADVADLEPQVREFEPRLALDGGDDGLDPYRRIVAGLPAIMRADGWSMVAFEVGIRQAPQVASMITDVWGQDSTEIIRDLQGIERMVIGMKR